MTIASEFPIPGVLPVPPDAASPVRRLDVSLGSGTADPAWRSPGAERTVEMPGTQGSPVFTIDHHPHAGYRVWIEGLGHLVLNAEGTSLTYAPVADGDLRYRLLIGQGLPIAAALQGLEVIHASAVVHHGLALAFAARSGTGKTALALAMVRRGATFLADDVVAIEAVADGLAAYPGVAVAHADTNDGPEERSPVGAEAAVGPPRVKRHAPVSIHRSVVGMGGLYFLDRGPEYAHTVIRRIEPDATTLLGATFVPHVPTAARLTRQLDICSRLARTLPVYEIAATSAEAPDDIAGHLIASLP